VTQIHVRLREWETVRPGLDDVSGLRGVSFDSDDDRAIARALGRAGMLEITELRDGIHVRSFAHVGRIQLGNVVITIEPKLPAADLLPLFRHAYGLRNLRLFDAAEFAVGDHPLQDLIAAQLRTEVVELIERGVSRRYVWRSELLGRPRGRIDMEHLARHMPLVLPRLPCRHTLRSADHHLNRVVLEGLVLAAAVARDPWLRNQLAQLAAAMAVEVRRTTLNVSALRRAWDQLDRMTSSYSAALRLIEIIFACSAVAFDGETKVQIPGFLFDMNRFFQALVGRILREHLPDLEVRDEHGLSGMMRYLPSHNPRARRAPTPRPDFALVLRGRMVALLDAKYRDLWSDSLPREMLYQLVIYAMSQRNAATAGIIYPTTAVEATEAVIEVRAPHDRSVLGYVALRPLVLPRFASALRAASPGVARAEALALAFGAARSET
jgi:5-methylcytosine-specific restriction enzyme subunit McrC